MGIVGAGLALTAWLGLRRRRPLAVENLPGGAPAPAPGGSGHVREPHPTGVFAAVGRFDYRFRRLLLVLGLAAVIGVNLWASAAGGELIQGGWVIPGSEEQRAAELLP